MDERKLVILAIAGEQDAFVELYKLYYTKLYRYAAYTLRGVQDAEDAVSETMVDAYEGIKKLKNPDVFGTWIFRILSNKCKAKMRDYYVAADEEVPEEAANVDMTLNLSVKEMFLKLPKKERMVVALSVFAGYDSKEIGDILKMNASTVRSIRKRTLEKMAREMND